MTIGLVAVAGIAWLGKKAVAGAGAGVGTGLEALQSAQIDANQAGDRRIP